MTRQFATLLCQVFCTICGILLFALWAQQGRQAEYGWLALVAISWTAASLGSGYPGISTEPAFVIGTLAFALLALSLYYWIASLVPERTRALTLAVPLLLFMSLVFLGITTTAADHLPTVVSLWRFCFLALSIYALSKLIGKWYRHEGVQLWSALAVLITINLLLLDIALTIQLVNFEPFGLLVFAGPVFVGTFSWHMLSSFIDKLRNTEALNVQLDQMVKEKTSELEAQHLRIQDLQRDQILAQERERIMRDMHDGVGGQLVSTMAMMEKGSINRTVIQQALADALTDMRLMIDSLSPVNEDLNAVLAVFRDRMQPRLSAANIELLWRVEDIPTIPGMRPSMILSVLRILQETFTNSIKHGKASSIAVTARHDENLQTVLISVSDNGVGFRSDTLKSTGHGLNNMRQRAAENDFGFQIESLPGMGTTVTLRFLSFRD